MSSRPISPLRQRMLEDMAVRKFGDKTRRDYIRHVEAFASFGPCGASASGMTGDLPYPRGRWRRRRRARPGA
jgi:hypothetical protein